LNKNFQYIFLLFNGVALTTNSFTQNAIYSNLVNRKLLNRVIVIESAAGLTSLGALSVSWYSDYSRSSFHFFNDNNEWLQMDKAGHVTSAYFITKTSYDLLRWPGVERKKAVWYGGAIGFTYLAMVEVMDGFSADWGFSPGDLAANTIGSVAFIGQQLIWNEQRISLKWSYHGTSYPHYRPNVLGRNLPEKTLKDYNGQTYWLSVNIHSFLPKESKFPNWLNVACGYSAEGMLGAYSNPSEIDGKILPAFDRFRQYFLSLDLDLTRVKTKSKALNAIFNFVGVLKFPFPAIEYNSGNHWKLHGIYF
jgi:hypothetical protein